MPEKSSAVATYAISASLAALVLGYVFGPSIFPDESYLAQGLASKRVAVGLSNPANDCFINSVLQALAGLKTLRDYLEQIALTGDASDGSNGISLREKSRYPDDRTISIALKAKLDELNKVSRSKKTISATDFIRALESAFGASISRRQQDAQEFLQLVAERLDEEFNTYKKHLNRNGEREGAFQIETGEQDSQVLIEKHVSEPLFPLEGTLESQIECYTCKYKPKTNSSSFVTLTLNVPEKNSTTLDECLDGLLKMEVIDGFKCDRCQVEFALRGKEKQLQAQNLAAGEVEKLQSQIQTLGEALEDHSRLEKATKLADSGSAPRQRISKFVRISSYPAVLALHLSRSIYSLTSLSMKNAAKVEFPETLALGFPYQKKYRLACVVTHRGGHNSGHYETFRRQYNETEFQLSEDPLVVSSPVEDGTSTTEADLANRNKAAKRRHKAQMKLYSKWWCISDAKVRECTTLEVLRMLKEVYLLFYELQQPVS